MDGEVRCRCALLNNLTGDLARDYARRHLDMLDKGEKLMTSHPCPVQVWRFGDELTMVALGDGVVKLRDAMRAAAYADWMLVELDACAGDMKEAVRRSAEWLTRTGIARP